MPKVTYADEVIPDFGIPFPTGKLRVEKGELKLALSPEEIRATPDEELQTLYDLMEKQPILEKQDPVKYGWTLESWRKVMENWRDTKIHIILGGNRCLHRDTLVPICRGTDQFQVPIQEIRDGDAVMSVIHKTEGIDWDWRSVEGDAISKGYHKCVKVVLNLVGYRNSVEGVMTFICSENHQIKLQFRDEYIAAKNLTPETDIEVYPNEMNLYRVRSVEPAGKHEVWDITVPKTENYYAQGCFHHNSTKSTFANRLLVDMAQKIDEARIYHWHDNEERSVVDAQATIFNSLPSDLREKGQKRGGQNYSVTYNQKTGFVGRLPTCILPPRDGIDKGSSIFFKYYTQYLQNQQVAEGFNAHIVEMDEECPLKLFQTMIPRTVDFHGRIILTFTTLQGWTPLIAELLKGAETVATRYAPTEGRELPVEQICHAWPSARIYYWWTQDNPFIDSHHLVEQYVNQPVEERLARLYGIPTKTQQGKFPKFNKDVNVVPHGEIPFIKHPDKYPVTRYFITDPAGTKPWIAVWIGVISDGRVYVYRESPTEEWCQPHVNNAGTPVGKPSVGQKPNGWGYLQWKEHFLGLEQDEEIIQRICDPGFGTQKVTKTDGQTDIFAEMASLDFHMIPVFRGDVESGVSKINDLLAWDDRKPLSEINRPQLYVSDQCQNTINSMLEYTGCSKEEHWKDFVDGVRYGVVNGLHFCENGNLECTGGGGY